MKKLGLLFIGLLVLVPGCCRKTKNKRKKMEQSPKEVVHNQKKNQKTVNQEVDIALADNKIKSYFDDSLEEFAFENSGTEGVSAKNVADIASYTGVQEADTSNDYSWTNLSQDSVKSDFDNVYFDFDKYNIKCKFDIC